MAKKTRVSYYLSCNDLGLDCPFSLTSPRGDEVADRMLRHMHRPEHYNELREISVFVGGEEKLNDFFLKNIHHDIFSYDDSPPQSSEEKK